MCMKKKREEFQSEPEIELPEGIENMSAARAYEEGYYAGQASVDMDDDMDVDMDDAGAMDDTGVDDADAMDDADVDGGEMGMGDGTGNPMNPVM